MRQEQRYFLACYERRKKGEENKKMRKGKIIVASMILFCVVCFAAGVSYFLLINKIIVRNPRMHSESQRSFKSPGWAGPVKPTRARLTPSTTGGSLPVRSIWIVVHYCQTLPLKIHLNPV
ncbi:hypothetical protein SGGMMB4_01264 [Sodalis glossinidius str. 'morsitans']|uniref:Uncharacterized protein n=1 Tax=Sodalis glossinidius (strain morsitans) TaxID=343509 RepID=A0A193QGF6_SODGM|nr:hypothetical protein SGGMMB4_01264 [Sodalis glossinidius str. 'morsitans']